MTIIIDGKKIAESKQEILRGKILSFPSKPSFAIILVGQNPSSIIYVNNKIKSAFQIGIDAKLISLPSTITTEELTSKIHELNNDDKINGIIVQLPLPDHIDNYQIINSISPYKDIDGFHPLNVGLLYSGKDPLFTPCTPLGILELIQNYYNNFAEKISSKHAVIVGRSNIVGRPLASLLLKNDLTVTICHSKTNNLKSLTKQADIIICASGQMLAFDSNYFSKDSVVIDVGIARTEEGKIVGDVLFDNVFGNIAGITKVPGGVGPMTIVCLMENIVKSYEKQINILK
jgi:methylenetetrahydrofolate dehydrogenase (NADP+)/methenyltetrahydrofolate cyclohydrolase